MGCSSNKTILLAALALASRVVVAQSVGNCEPSRAEEVLDINNVSAPIFANGSLFWSRDAAGPTEYFVPKNGGVSSIFSSTVWIGGKVNNELRMAASRYGPFHFWTGPLDESGDPPPDCGVYDRIWKVSRLGVANFEAGDPPTPDLREWPTGLGAPTMSPTTAEGNPVDADGLDNDQDGSVDEPGEMRFITDEILALPLSLRADRRIDLDAGERPDILGDQMLWWILNDAGNKKVFGYQEDGVTPRAVGEPIGLEVHGSAFALHCRATSGMRRFTACDSSTGELLT